MLIEFILFCAITVSDQTSANVTIGDLQDLAGTRVTQVQSLSFDCVTLLQRHVENPPKFCADVPALAWIAESYAAQNDMRYYSRSSGKTPEEPVQTRIETWNGKARKLYMPTERTGVIEGSLEDRHGWDYSKFAIRATPFDMALTPDTKDGSHIVSMDLRNFLNAEGMQIYTETETVDDSECIVVATEKRDLAVWLDQGRGLVVKKCRQPMPPSLVATGVTAKVIYNEAFEEYRPGQWVVTRGRIQFLGPDPTGSQPGEIVLTERIAEYSNIKVNESIPEEKFDFVFPTNTHVIDQVLKTSYRVGQSDSGELLDGEIAKLLDKENSTAQQSVPVDSAAVEREMSASQPPLSKESSSSSSVNVGLAATLLILTVVMAVFIAKRLRAGYREPRG